MEIDGQTIDDRWWLHYKQMTGNPQSVHTCYFIKTLNSLFSKPNEWRNVKTKKFWVVTKWPLHNMCYKVLIRLVWWHTQVNPDNWGRRIASFRTAWAAYQNSISNTSHLLTFWKTNSNILSKLKTINKWCSYITTCFKLSSVYQCLWMEGREVHAFGLLTPYHIHI